jgi:hypothetical protein
LKRKRENKSHNLTNGATKYILVQISGEININPQAPTSYQDEKSNEVTVLT